MRRLNTWLGEHLWATVLLSVFLAGLVILLISPGRSWWEVFLRVGAISLGGVGFVFHRRRKDKRVTGGSDRTVVGLEERIRLGRVPEDAGEREAMARLVAHRLRQTRYRWWALAGLYVLFGAVAVGFASTADAPRAAVVLALAAAFLAWMTWTSVNQHRRLRSMAEQVGQTGRGGAARPRHTEGHTTMRRGTA
ncbi:hypothetical protein [Streptomyces sp. NPDC015131]|uniref:hypothetical protein n=1 Tax=Streptomyces sp. NPDC015131 TaxID=3364941 RepID=UPI0036F882F5